MPTIGNHRSCSIAVLAVALAAPAHAGGGGITMGLLQNDPGSFEGYTLFTQLQWPVTYLIDHDGQVVNTWTSAHPPGNSQYLLDDGTLMRTGDPGGNGVIAAGGDAGIVEHFDWDGNVLWSFTYNDSTVRAHHDIAPLPNGNILVLAWERKLGPEAIAAGRDPALLSQNELWPEHVIEVVTSGPNAGDIVWEWYLWDHLIQDFDAGQANFGVVGDHPELLDINAAAHGLADWIHANAIDYNAELDQIVISSPFLNELYVIDHSTTTAEAAGHSGGNAGRGGDILYRWGNPANYDAGTAADRTLFGQHDVQWIPPGRPGAGNILIFNNGVNRPGGNYSSVDEIVTPVNPDGTYALTRGSAYGPAAPTWSYEADPPTSLFASFISGAQRLPNGNTLICSGPQGRFFEVTPALATVWDYRSPVSGFGPLTQGGVPTGTATFRAERYAPDHPGLAGQNLNPGPPIELYPCFGDFDNDGAVAVDDLLRLLSAWAALGGFEDINQDGIVNLVDLLELLGVWGACP